MSAVASKPAIEIDARIGDVVATLGFIPAVMPTVVAERNIDALDYHQRGVLKDARSSFPAGRRAQKFLAARMFKRGRTSKGRLPKTMQEAHGTGIAVEGRKDLLTSLEEGGVRTSTDPMAIPVADRFRKKSKVFWQDTIKKEGFELVPGRGIVYIIKAKKGGRMGAGSYTLGGHEIVGVLKRRVTLRPLLNWYDRWKDNLPKVLAKYDKDMEKLLTASGRQALRERITKETRVRDAARIAEREYLNANPGNNVGAGRAARAAARAVRRDSLAKQITVAL